MFTYYKGFKGFKGFKKMQLYDYQITGRDFLSSRQNACLWDEPGLGKSFQALAALKENKSKNAIIICPASVRMVWERECQKLNLDSHVVTSKEHIGKGINIVSYEGASGRCFGEFMMRYWDALVCDEAHYLKSHTAKRTTKIYGKYCNNKESISGRAEYNWSLTGTPMPNNPSELWPTLRSRFPDAIAKRNEQPMSYWEFVSAYCKTMDNGFGIQITGGKNLNRLRDQLRGRCLRRKKSEVLKDLPPVRYHMLPVEGKLKVDNNEEAIVKKCLESDEPLVALKKVGTHVASLRRFTGMAKTDSIIKWVQEQSYEKIVLFAHHKAVIDELRTIPHSVYIDGSCSQDERVKAVNDFQEGDARVFIGQLQAAGTGLTLTAANVLVFVEASWVPAENRQAADRIHRIGQRDSCLVYFASIPGSIDDDIMNAVRRKTEIYKELGL